MIFRFIVTMCALAFLMISACSDNSTDSNGNNNIITNAIPEEGLVAKYSFAGNANDETVNANHGTVYGATLVSGRKGRPNNAYSFDGINDSIVFPYLPLSVDDQVTVSLWVKVAEPSSLKYFAICDDFGVWQRNDTLGIAISVPQTNSARGPFTLNTWTHFAGTYNGDTIKCYINGNLVDEKSWPGSISDLGRHLVLGFFNSDFWTGTLDDIRIYSRVLPQPAIDSLFNE